MSTEPIDHIDPAVAEILSSSDVWDMTLPWVPDYWDMETLARYKRAGFTFVSATLQDWPPTFEGTLDCIARFKEKASSEAPWITFGASLAEIDQGRREGKLVVGFNSQETLVLGMDLERIEALYHVGVRHMVLAYNIRNFVADGCAEAADAGLSNFGRQVIKEMNRLGMIVDCSHTGRRSSLEAIDLSQRPVIFSHSGSYAVCPHIRNIRDEQIRACASQGGVIGVVGLGAFLGDAEARTESLFRHLDYIAALVGHEHVGLGLDYVPPFFFAKDAMAASGPEKEWPDPTIGWPDPTGTQMSINEGTCFQPEHLVELVQCMLTHGYSTESVRSILGGNFRRVYAGS
jgi:membrane dipeptidase